MHQISLSFFFTQMIQLKHVKMMKELWNENHSPKPAMSPCLKNSQHCFLIGHRIATFLYSFSVKKNNISYTPPPHHNGSRAHSFPPQNTKHAQRGLLQYCILTKLQHVRWCQPCCVSFELLLVCSGLYTQWKSAQKQLPDPKVTSKNKTILFFTGNGTTPFKHNFNN